MWFPLSIGVGAPANGDRRYERLELNITGIRARLARPEAAQPNPIHLLKFKLYHDQLQLYARTEYNLKSRSGPSPLSTKLRIANDRTMYPCFALSRRS